MHSLVPEIINSWNAETRLSQRNIVSMVAADHVSMYRGRAWATMVLTHLPLNKMAALLADDIFKCIFLNENEEIPIKISLAFFLKGMINNIPALVQIKAWHRPGSKPLSEPILTQFTNSYMQH